MSEIPRIWRLNQKSLRFTGFIDPLEKGGIKVSFTGISWYTLEPPPKNGSDKNELNSDKKTTCPKSPTKI